MIPQNVIVFFPHMSLLFPAYLKYSSHSYTVPTRINSAIKNKTHLCSLKLLLCISQNIFRYLSVSVSVALVHNANFACAWLSGEIGAFRLWCVTPDYGSMVPSSSPVHCRCVCERERVTGRHQPRFGGWWQRGNLWWRPPFCHRRLTHITPSAIFLLCMLMKQRRGVMRKEWQMEGKDRNKKEKYSREMKPSVWRRAK